MVRLTELFRIGEMGRRDLSHIDPDTLDWTRPNSELARELGVSQPTVAKWRAAQTGAPAAVVGQVRPGPGRRPKGAQADVSNVDWNRPLSDVADDLGVTPAMALYLRRKAGVAAHPTRPGVGAGGTSVDWSDVDWSRPDGEIAGTKGVARTSVAYMRRKLAGGVHGTGGTACPGCGKELQPSDLRRGFCSPECRARAAAMRQK